MYIKVATCAMNIASGSLLKVAIAASTSFPIRYVKIVPDGIYKIYL